jgi:uncharacterized RDD family membrane protein YckC
MEHQDILDHNLTPPPINPGGQPNDMDPLLYTASSGLRFANYLIDSIIKGILDAVIFLVLGISDLGESAYGGDSLENIFLRLLVSVFTSFLYLGIMEGATGRTLGKMITGTIVVDRDGNRISWGQAFGRSACRLIPFEAFSFLGSSVRGWHDSIPGTYVVNRQYADMRAQQGDPIVY